MKREARYLGRKLVLCFAVRCIQIDSISSDKALQVLVLHEVLAKPHVTTVDVLPAIWKLEKELDGSCKAGQGRPNCTHNLVTMQAAT